jgi:PAS domain S-box-containing protein
MEDSQSLNQQVEVAYRRLRELLERSGASPEALETLAASLEGLRRAGGELEARAQAEAAGCRAAQAALAAERILASTVLDTVGALVVVLDREGRIVRFNRMCEQATGYAFEEVEGRPFWDFLLIPEEVAPVRATFDDLRTGHFPNEFETYWVAHDGSRKLIAWTNTAIPSPDGSPEYIIGTGLDITRRRQAESQREAALEEVRSLARFPAENPNPVLRLDHESTLLYANQASVALLREWGCRVGDPVPPIYRDLVADALVDGTPRTVDVPSGERVYSFSVVPVVEAGYVNLYGRDITARVQVEQERERLLAELHAANEELQAKNEELQSQAEELEVQAEELRSQTEELHFQTLDLEKEQARLRAIIDSAPEAMLVADERGEVVLANPAAERLFAVPAHELGGPADRENTARYRPNHTPYRMHELPIFRAAVHRETQRDIPMALPWPDGQWRDVLVNAVPILDSHGQSHGAVAVYQDVTERLQAEKALQVALEKYRVLIESFPLGITISDETGHILETNKEGERLLGIAQAEQTRRRVGGPEWQLIRPDGSPMPAEEYASVRALREKRLIDNVEMGIVKEGGAVTWLNVTAAPIPLEGYGVAVAYGDITARKEAESQREAARSALRDSQQRFGSLVASMTEGVALHSLVCDAQGQPVDYVILDVNPAFEAITGLARDEAVGRKASELYGTGQPPYLETYAKVAASEEPASFETYFPPMDKHFSVSVFSPGLGQFATVFADITEQVQVAAERERLLARARQDREAIAALAQALEKEWHTLQAIMESTHAQLAYLDPDFNFVRVNSAYAQGSGHSREELIGHNHFDLFPNAENQAIFEQVRATGQPVGFHAKPFEFADQPERGVTYWDWTLVPVKEGDGQVRGLVLSLLDVSDQVLSRRAVEELAARDEAILNSLGEGVVTLGPAGDVLAINPAALRILGFEGIEHARRRFEESPNSFEARDLNGAAVPVEASPQARLLRGETFSGYEMQVRDLVTGLTWIGSFSGAPVRDAAGNLAMGVLAVHDITVEKQAQAQRDAMLEELKAALAEKEVLMREIYHRVKNNVQALIYLMDMQADYIPDEDTRQMIRELQERARAMALVHEKLYQSQNLAQIDFGDYLYDLVNSLSHAFGADRPIIWRIDVEDVPLSVDTAIPCGLIVSELLTNALKYAFPGGRPITTRGETDCTVSVASRVEGNQITLVVADNGVGLPAGVDWATTKTMGLQLINVLARHQLGGQVEVDRRAGTSFKITFAERTRK